MFNDTEIIHEIDRLKRFAYKLTRNSSRAEDLLQETLLRAIEKKDLYQSGTNLFSWTSKVMYNIFVSNYRHSARYETLCDPEIFIQLQTVEPAQEHTVEMGRIIIAMRRLTNDHSKILVMVCVLGMQYAEVAESLQIPIGTVRSRLTRAREKLQDILNTPILHKHDLLSIPSHATMESQRYKAF